MVPWGRSREEYVKMFAITAPETRGRTLDCGAGPASFDAEATVEGHRVVSCEPLYSFSADQIRTRVALTRPITSERAVYNVKLSFLILRYAAA